MSPWPLLGAISSYFFAKGLVNWFLSTESRLLVVSLLLLVLVASQWWLDVAQEAAVQGLHSGIVELGLRWGVVLFILSEVMLFVSFFWAFFHSGLVPVSELGSVWPPVGVSAFSPWGVPLLNTILLLSSGVTVTWAHHSMMEGGHTGAVWGLTLSALLGVYFTGFQGMEYMEATFSMADSVYGSVFYLATGFHGAHVIIGTLFLLVSLARVMGGQMSALHHFGLEAAAWYWHFVDVVWLFLFVTVYWWGGA